MDLLHVVKSRAGRNFVFKKVFPVLILTVVALFLVASIAGYEKEARDSWTVIPVLVASCSILFIAYYFAREAPVLIINELSVLLDSEQKYFCYAQQNSVI